ncbi:hypothetical protein SAMN06295912_11755 [Sphingomonas laterariae]|uniref:Uncharacterized protein n=1 Tax=Edaphosphingomonas laterariae TaxID=861865 RepID=A0A239HJ35_9SPHN|nr:hypothetical protein [Sphingomonas laterariae]SNS81436.1 hypothetical protein SAMN06295912_11755 [Sphingomonas laterariae]
MIRLVLGAIAGGVAQFIVGFIFWGTPLSRLAYTTAGEAENAAVQAALAQNLASTGTYVVPWPDTAQGTVLYGRGPIATVHYNVAGFPAFDSGSLIAGLVLSILTAMLIGLALWSIATRVTSFAERLKLIALFAGAAVLYLHIGQPIFNHYGWGYFIYLAIADLAGLIVAGAVIARWFLPKPVA